MGRAKKLCLAFSTLIIWRSFDKELLHKLHCIFCSDAVWKIALTGPLVRIYADFSHSWRFIYHAGLWWEDTDVRSQNSTKQPVDKYRKISFCTTCNILYNCNIINLVKPRQAVLRQSNFIINPPSQPILLVVIQVLHYEQHQETVPLVHL